MWIIHRYEATLWRQAVQILHALDALDRRKPQERRRRAFVSMIVQNSRPPRMTNVQFLAVEHQSWYPAGNGTGEVHFASSVHINRALCIAFVDGFRSAVRELCNLPVSAIQAFEAANIANDDAQSAAEVGIGAAASQSTVSAVPRHDHGNRPGRNSADHLSELRQGRPARPASRRHPRRSSRDLIRVCRRKSARPNAALAVVPPGSVFRSCRLAERVKPLFHPRSNVRRARH